MMAVRGRKGQDFLADLVSYFIVVLVVIVFWMIAGLITRNLTNQINEEAVMDLTTTDFLMLLREPTIYGGTISDIIIQSEFDNQKRTELTALLTTRFTAQYTDSWHFEITYPDGKTVSLGYGAAMAQSTAGQGNIIVDVKNKAYLPSMGGGDITVEMQTWGMVNYYYLMFSKKGNP